MNCSELKKLLEKIVGLRLTYINLALEMMCFGFEGYAIDVQCLTRIIKNDDILVTTLDYQVWDGEESENNDEWFNLNRFKPVIVGGKVTSIQLNPLCDLTITLDNDITIQILIENGYSHYDEESEQYRFFKISEDNTENHFVVYNKHIEVN